MRKWWAAGSLIALACAANANVASEPAAPSGLAMTAPAPGAKVGATSATPPARPPPAVASGSCVDPLEGPSPSVAEGTKRIEAALDTLGGCTKGLDERGVLRLMLTPAFGAPAKVRVLGSSVHDCKAVACLKRGLEKVELPLLDPGSETFALLLTLAPHTPPRLAPRAELSELESATSCADPKQEPTERLPPDQIQSVVRSHYPRVQKCYEAGLHRDPNLSGKVEIRFVIGRDGRVQRARLVASTMPDCAVARCVRDEFRTLVFPPPPEGVVTVVYPMRLEPDERRNPP